MTVEYRVVWQREPHRWPDGCESPSSRRYSQHYASLAAARRKAMRLQGRIAESKGYERDLPICCFGDSCSCEGRTWGEWEDATTAEWAPLLMLRIESREVGDWTACNAETETGGAA